MAYAQAFLQALEKIKKVMIDNKLVIAVITTLLAWVLGFTDYAKDRIIGSQMCAYSPGQILDGSGQMARPGTQGEKSPDVFIANGYGDFSIVQRYGRLNICITENRLENCEVVADFCKQEGKFPRNKLCSVNGEIKLSLENGEKVGISSTYPASVVIRKEGWFGSALLPHVLACNITF